MSVSNTPVVRCGSVDSTRATSSWVVAVANIFSSLWLFGLVIRAVALASRLELAYLLNLLPSSYDGAY